MRIPLTPLLGLLVAVSSTGESKPMVFEEVRIELRDWTQPLAEATTGVRSYLGSIGGRLASTIDDMRAAAKLPAPDLSMLTTEPVVNMSTSGFGWREDPITKRRKFHSGADIRGNFGTPVAAAGAGKVIFAGQQSGYGNLVMVDHGSGIVTRYAHLQRILVKKDAEVTAGQLVGKVGATGRTTGPHLHFEVRIDGHPVDPTIALTVAGIERESPAAGHLAAQVLAPDVQSAKLSDIDPPRGQALVGPPKGSKSAAKTETKPEARPERTNAPVRVKKPTS